jgi:23S rRNA pseudouridine1911/1915/1917 synthase
MKIVFENENLLAVDKPAGIIVFPEGAALLTGKEKTLIDLLLEKYPNLKNAGTAPRYGVVHRLDKDTSGIILIAKTNQALSFLQKQFEQRKVEKKYILLIADKLKTNKGIIETLIGRANKDKRKQKVYLPHEPSGSKNLRKAKTEYKVIKRFQKFTLIKAFPETGRKHQLRVHFAYLGHPIVGDKLYGFKNQIIPSGLKRQFLHAKYLKIKLLNGKTKELNSELPEDLKKILNNLKNE